jgi:serine/threonine-protein kinase
MDKHRSTPTGPLEATLAAAVPAASPARSTRGGSEGFMRTTVLPKATPASVEPSPQPGIERRFEQVQMLGAGGMGEVALVEDRDIQRRVALKRLRAGGRSEPALARFAEEVRIIGQLEHPNITPVHDVGIDEDGQHYFVMKFVEGETLESIIGKLKAGDPAYARRFSHDQRIEVFIGILNAVRYAHARGIIHRDLKPANIMVGKFGEVTVVDWGIAKKLARPESAGDSSPPSEAGADPRGRTVDGALVGTPMYMSPEQAAGDLPAVDERSDIYSLSLVLFELLTLGHPLAGKPTVEAVLAALIADGLDASVGHIKTDLARAGAPADYAELISRGLQRDPARRFASVDALEQALKEVREGKVPVSCHITLTKRAIGELALFIDRRPVLFSLLFGLVILTFVAGTALAVTRVIQLLK